MRKRRETEDQKRRYGLDHAQGEPAFRQRKGEDELGNCSGKKSQAAHLDGAEKGGGLKSTRKRDNGCGRTGARRFSEQRRKESDIQNKKKRDIFRNKSRRERSDRLHRGGGRFKKGVGLHPLKSKEWLRPLGSQGFLPHLLEEKGEECEKRTVAPFAASKNTKKKKKKKKKKLGSIYLSIRNWWAS